MTNVFAFSQTQEKEEKTDKTQELEQEIESLKNIIAEDEEYLEWKKQKEKRKKDFEM